MFFNECMKFSSETQYTYRYSNFKGSSDSVLLELNFLPTIYFLKTFNLLVDPFHATGLSLYPLKISENLWFSDFFRDYRKKLVGHEIRMKLVKKKLLERLRGTYDQCNCEKIHKYLCFAFGFG